MDAKDQSIRKSGEMFVWLLSPPNTVGVAVSGKPSSLTPWLSQEEGAGGRNALSMQLMGIASPRVSSREKQII
jgi:hypothetical protein